MDFPQNMLAAVFESEGRLAVVDQPVPALLSSRHALVRVEVCGVCGTDLRFLAVPPILKAEPGVILGHEYVGEIVLLGSEVEQYQVGDRVAVMPDVACGYCPACMAGRPNLCENVVSIGGDVDGGFAQYAVAPASALCQVPASIPAEEAAFIELLSCVAAGVEKAGPALGKSVVVIGAGPAGLTYMKLFLAAGAGQVIVADLNPWRAAFALRSGAHYAINPDEQDLVEEVQRITGNGADIVVDAVGSTLDVAIDCAGPGGRIIVFGEDARASCTVRPYDIQHRELQILGSFIGPYHFTRAVQMLEGGVADVRNLITHRLSLSELPGGIAELAAGRGAKGICLPWS